MAHGGVGVMLVHTTGGYGNASTRNDNNFLSLAQDLVERIKLVSLIRRRRTGAGPDIKVLGCPWLGVGFSPLL